MFANIVSFYPLWIKRQEVQEREVASLWKLPEEDQEDIAQEINVDADIAAVQLELDDILTLKEEH